MNSCSTENFGCSGGYPSKAYDYVSTYGLELESTYPYTSGGGASGTCNYNSAELAVAKGTIEGT